MQMDYGTSRAAVAANILGCLRGCSGCTTK